MGSFTKEHIYTHPMGHKVPSPSGIIGQLDKPALVYWAANCACDYIIDEVKNKKNLKKSELYSIIESARKNFRKVSGLALDIGSAVHHAIQLYLEQNREPEAPSDEVLSAFLAFLEWQDKHKVQTLHTEYTVYDPDGMYAGTLDWHCMVDGVETIIDFKTSKKPSNSKGYAEWGYQLAAYGNCIGVKNVMILRLDKETGYPDVYDFSEDFERNLQIFKHLTEIFYLRNPKFEWRKK